MGVIVARPVSLASSTSSRIFQEIPSGSVDGMNDTFGTAFPPVPAGSLMVIKNGLIMMSGSSGDYLMISSTTFQFNSGAVPLSGSNLFIRYDY